MMSYSRPIWDTSNSILVDNSSPLSRHTYSQRSIGFLLIKVEPFKLMTRFKSWDQSLKQSLRKRMVTGMLTGIWKTWGIWRNLTLICSIIGIMSKKIMANLLMWIHTTKRWVTNTDKCTSICKGTFWLLRSKLSLKRTLTINHSQTNAFKFKLKRTNKLKSSSKGFLSSKTRLKT